MKKQTMVYVLVAGLVVAVVAALAFRAAAARRAQAESEAMATEPEDATDQRKCVTVNAGETATASDKGIEVRPTAQEETKP